MNIVHWFETHAERRPDHPGLVFGDRSWSYRELDEALSRVAGGLAAVGVGRGDRVAVMLPNWPEFHFVTHATWKLGAVEVPINTMYRAEEVGYILGDAGARVVVVHAEALPEVLAVRDDLPDLGTIVVVGGEGPDGTTTLDALMAEGDTSVRAPDMEDDELAIIAYTSGTTGFPKGAMLSHRHVMLSMAQLRDHLGLGADDNVLQVLPLFHSNASMIGIVFGWFLGSTAILVERFDAAGFAEVVRRTEPSFFAGVPTLLFDIMNLPDDVEVDFSSVKYVTYGAASAPPQVRQRVEDRFGLKLRQAWGMTEAPNLVTIDALEGPIEYEGVGLPLPHIQVVAVDLDDRVLGPGEVGELCLQARPEGPHEGVYRPMLGYWNRPEASADALQNGRFHTGDVGFVDEHGVVHLKDRKKDMIIRGGNNIFPAELERVLTADDRVSEAYVVGVPDDRLGEVPKAFVVPETDAHLDADDVRAIVGGQLARYKRLEDVSLIASEDLPRSALGKVLKRQLRESGTA